MTSHETFTEKAVLVLFRTDLRIADNGALAAAVESGKPVVAAFILDEESANTRVLGGARRWWLHHSLSELQGKIARLGGELVLRRGRMEAVVDDLIEASGADIVLWNRRYDPAETEVDRSMKANLRSRGIDARSFDGQLLHEPSLLKTRTGGFYKVYTPFWRALEAAPPPRDPIDPPRKLLPFKSDLKSILLADFNLLPTKPNWAGGLKNRWQPGEDGAHQRLSDFLDEWLENYANNRDVPGIDATSRLSPHLAQGEITPFQIFAALDRKAAKLGAADSVKFRKEIGWREFSYHLLFHNPELRRKNFQTDFDGFPWQSDRKSLLSWQRGMTGYPIVDAGMRELWQTGWMHNRVRMIAASFLIKHLLIDWRDGEEWFWDTLVDADPASNPASWQWVAGSGADAAPYFRIFNPILQGEKFDPEGTYVRRYIPELTKLPDKYLHKPWEASKELLASCAVKLGDTYPAPIIDHRAARERAMRAYRHTRSDD